MPITTATAIAAGTQLAGAAASFAQAAKNNRLRREAEEAAKKYMEDAEELYYEDKLIATYKQTSNEQRPLKLKQDVITQIYLEEPTLELDDQTIPADLLG